MNYRQTMSSPYDCGCNPSPCSTPQCGCMPERPMQRNTCERKAARTDCGCQQARPACERPAVRTDCGCQQNRPACERPAARPACDCGCQQNRTACERPAARPTCDCGCQQNRPVCERPAARPACDCERPAAKPACGCNKKMDDYPVAMAYVPWQYYHDTFDLQHALMMGTIFPELCQPFCGRGPRC